MAVWRKIEIFGGAGAQPHSHLRRHKKTSKFLHLFLNSSFLICCILIVYDIYSHIKMATGV